jgi:branched-chain amino acid transport system permease protein
MLDKYQESLLIFFGINLIAAYSFYLPFKTGQVSLGQAGFMGVGAYASGIITTKLGMSFPLGLATSALVAGLVGLLVGFPALRIKGIYLLLLTLGFGQIFQVIALTWDYTGAHNGFQSIPKQHDLIYYIYGVLVLIILFFYRLERSSLGRAMVAIHTDEDAAEVMGIDIVRVKLFAFSFGAAFAGLAGCLFAHMTTYVDSLTFDILLAVNILMFVVVGGGTTYIGPIVGTTVLYFFPEFLRTLREWMELIPIEWTENSVFMTNAYDWLYDFLDFENVKRLIAYALILILMMIWRPQGLISRDQVTRWRRRLIGS